VDDVKLAGGPLRQVALFACLERELQAEVAARAARQPPALHLA
jgi:hypothetical protein